MRRPLSLLVALLITCPLLAADYPTHTIKSDQLTLTVYLPDAEKGFYRGTRFDWSGVFGVQFGKHKLFGPWKGTHDPANNDDIVGPCEEFGNSSPLGYETAKPGETFVKIGVGELEKAKDEKYNFFGKYKIVKPGEWKVAMADSKVTFEQSLTAASGYGYKYTKIVAVQDAEVRIQHVLENTGKLAINTDCYNHNFFNVDADPVGKNYTLEFGFEPKADAPKERWKELVKLDGKTLSLTGPLDKGSIFAEVGGHGTTDSKENRVTMKHAPSGVSVRVTGDKPLKKVNVWGIGSTICPEPYVALDIAPGKRAVWSWTYEFSKK
jgi:hypothetical protein